MSRACGSTKGPAYLMKLAKTIHLDITAGVLSIDGEPFGFYLADQSVSVDVTPGDPVRRVNLSILAEGVWIDGVEITDDITVIPPAKTIKKI